MKNKVRKKFYLNSFFSIMPGFISILLSFLSISIYSKYGNAQKYRNYIFLLYSIDANFLDFKK
jgi:hypothetical protein